VKAVVQRVTRAAVRVDEQTIGEIGRGLLVLLGFGKTDTPATADWMIAKLLALRIFPDDTGKMNRSVTDIGGGLLIISQFTLYGTLEKGTRPSFSDALPPAEAEVLYGQFMVKLRAATTLPVAEGRFAADMQVELVNDGPVTIIVERASRPFSAAPSSSATGATPVLLFQPFDPHSAADIHTRNLPHWEQAGCTYFVTFRLADSLPQEELRRWQTEHEQWLQRHPPPLSEVDRREYAEQFPDRFEHWLDAGHGACWLQRPELKHVVEQALRHFDGQRYRLGEFVVMPNHVHVLFTPRGEWTVEQVVRSWKSFTAHEINRQLKRTGPVWQAEYFDHIIRNEQQLQRFEEYIRQHPLGSGTGVSPVLHIHPNSRNGRDARSTIPYA
jgi:D-tyrosyl-tRNA(Tyr) deacylase